MNEHVSSYGASYQIDAAPSALASNPRERDKREIHTHNTKCQPASLAPFPQKTPQKRWLITVSLPACALTEDARVYGYDARPFRRSKTKKKQADEEDMQSKK